MRRGRASAGWRSWAWAVVASLWGIGAVFAPPVVAAPTTQAAQIAAGDAALADAFGSALAVSADGAVALVGARGKGNYRGVAYVFARDAAGSWREASKLGANDWQVGDYFGGAVALSGDGSVALIGAFGGAGRAGAVYAFARGGAGWTQAAKLTVPEGKVGDTFGSALALSADGLTAAIGAPNANGTSGAVYVFALVSGEWARTATLVADSQKMRDSLGTSVALSADGATVVAGATGRNSNAGTAYIFRRTDAGWEQAAQLRVDSSADGDFFGWSVAVSGDGKVAAVGTPNRTNYRGTVYLFAREGAASWSERGSLFVSDGAAGDRFGNSVAMAADGSAILVGAPNKNGQTGTAYLFGRIPGAEGTYVQQTKLTANDGAMNDRYGTAVAMGANGGVALVGAPERGDARGGAYLYV